MEGLCNENPPYPPPPSPPFESFAKHDEMFNFIFERV